MRTFLTATLIISALALAWVFRRAHVQPHSAAATTAPRTLAPATSTAAPTTASAAEQTTASPAPVRPHSFVRPPGLLGGGQPVRLHDIPTGTPLRESLDRLSPETLPTALARLSALTFNVLDAHSFRADSTGAIYASCPTPSASALANLAATEALDAASTTPDIAAAAIPIASVPIYHSRPGATKIIYLDFNGHIVTGTQWNSSNSVPSYDCMPYDLDGDYTTFSDEEQTRIQRIWARVSEDYAPFDVDVTTEQPATFTRTTARALITRNTDRNGIALPSSTGGGVAYLSVFGISSFATYSPAFIYANNLGSGSGAYTSEAVSHEIGHNFGLSHDGVGEEGYYDGHGSGEISWGPTMGSPYGMAVTQWSKGEYTGATNTEDDFAVLAGQLGYRPDDTGNTTATARAATLSGTALSASGLIETQGDTDVISFTATGTGALSLTALPYIDTATSLTGNLDIQLELLSSTGTVLALNNPTASPRASLATVITPGTYYLRITPSAAGAPLATPPNGYTLYGSRGQFFIDGTLPAPASITFVTFLAQYFTSGEQLDSLLSGPSADPDGDGLNNLVEYATARHPRQPDAPSTATTGLSGSYLTLTYDRRTDTADLSYTVQASDDLLTWTTPASIEQLSVTPLSATLERVTVRNATTTAPRRFLRLQVSTP